jgi:type III pantothenate kinase
VVSAAGRWLLIGNSRWHWAEGSPSDGDLRHWHESAPEAGLSGIGGPVADFTDLVAWAAVGPVEASWGLPAKRRLDRSNVPLRSLPPWLGIDRALAGWGAWQRQRASAVEGAVLVADAGTVLSLTRVDGRGRFRGWRLLAGVALQLRAMAQGTVALPNLPQLSELTELPEAAEPWPTETASAMASGVVRALAAALLEACRELQGGPEPTTLWLTGGDAQRLAPLLLEAALPLRLAPELVLDALVELSADRGP